MWTQEKLLVDLDAVDGSTDDTRASTGVMPTSDSDDDLVRSSRGRLNYF